MDDTLLFDPATVEEAGNLVKILKLYCELSGQTINTWKSAVVFSPNTSQEVREAIANCLGIRKVTAHAKYLGLPSVAGRSKSGMLVNIHTRV